MELEKKDIIIIILSVGFIISSGINIYLGLSYKWIEVILPQQTLVVGVPEGPPYIDPTDSWDSMANNVINQVVECLWWYNFSDPNTPIIHMLAVNETWISNTQLRVFLREGVRFHDGTPFNAQAVKWNLERLMYLNNHTGELDPPTQRPAKTHSLYEFPDGTPIFDHFEIFNDFATDIYLTAPYSTVIDAMCYVACGMLSPTSTPTNRFIKLGEDIVGTGPFDYEEYIQSEVRFSRWDNYWREPTEFDAMVYKRISDPITRNYAMVSGEIDFLLNWEARGDRLTNMGSEFFNLYRQNPWITFHQCQNPILDYTYLVLNNKKINLTWRKAISYAINHSQIIEFIERFYNYPLVKTQNPISPGLFGYDPTVKGPEYNLTFAREIVVSLGYGDLGWNDTQWCSAEFIIFNYTNTGRQVYTDLFPLLKDCLDLIGITILNFEFWFFDWWDHGEYLIEHFDLYWAHSSPNYPDALNMFLLMFCFPSIYHCSNAANVNDSWLQQKLEAGLLEINDTKRLIICKDIQYYVTEELFPFGLGYHTNLYFIHAADLYNVPYNSMGIFYAYPIKLNFTWSPYN